MSRYIDADKLIEDVRRKRGLHEIIKGVIYSFLHDAPTADVVEVKRGKWKVDETHDYEPYCSLCGHEPIAGEKYNYCPDCGADMRGDKR
jgi:hypothetical protein